MGISKRPRMMDLALPSFHHGCSRPPRDRILCGSSRLGRRGGLGAVVQGTQCQEVDLSGHIWFLSRSNVSQLRWS